MKIEITEDGSSTVYNPDMGEHYHSTQGAISEAVHTFIVAGLTYMNREPLSVLEVGFGTGLNALLTLLYSREKKMHINYDTLEAYPIEKEIWEKLNYTSLLKDNNNYLADLHNSEWNEECRFGGFHFKKINIKLENYIPDKRFDVIFFDAFSPDAQPEMWTEKELTKMFNCLKDGGVLVTYASKGDVRRTLRDIGFTVDRLEGYGKKHHMMRATKPNALNIL